MTTTPLFDPAFEQDAALRALTFQGYDYDDIRDRWRLLRQIDCILSITIAGDWWTIQRLVARLRKMFPDVGFPENSVQAQLRNLRKVGYVVERRHVARGLFEYRVSKAVANG